jgi:CrcB protein
MSLAGMVLVFLGGGLGSITRWAFGILAKKIYRGSFPLGTFWVNVTGAFLIGFLTVLLEFDWKDRFGHPLNALILTGYLGGYTTYSSLELDASKLMHNNKPRLALFYLVGTFVVGLTAAFLGGWLASQLK